MRLRTLDMLSYNIGDLKARDTRSLLIIKVIIALIIKYMYMGITYAMLNNQLYTATTSYGIDFTIEKELLGSVVFLLITIYWNMLRRSDTFLDTFLTVLFYVSYIPINSAFSLNNAPVDFFVLTTLYYIAVLIFTKLIGLVLENKAPIKEEKITSEMIDCSRNNAYLVICCVVVCILLIVHKISYNGLEWGLSMNADQVYTNRAEYRAYTNEISGTFIAYIISLIRNLAGAVIPFFIMYSLVNKKCYGVFLGVLTAFSMYAIANQKTDLLIIAVVVGVFVCFRLNALPKFDILLQVGLLLGIGLCFVESWKGSDKLYTLIVRRQMYLPAKLNVDYFDFFSTNEKILWRQDTFLIEKLFTPVYSSTTLDLINQEYYGGYIPSPNTGLFAEAYMHFGVIGILIYPVLIAATVNFMSRTYKRYGEAICVLMGSMFALSIINIPITWAEMVLSYLLLTIAVYTVSSLWSKYPLKMKGDRKWKKQM